MFAPLTARGGAARAPFPRHTAPPRPSRVAPGPAAAPAASPGVDSTQRWWPPGWLRRAAHRPSRGPVPLTGRPLPHPSPRFAGCWGRRGYPLRALPGKSMNKSSAHRLIPALLRSGLTGSVQVFTSLACDRKVVARKSVVALWRKHYTRGSKYEDSSNCLCYSVGCLYAAKVYPRI